MKSALTIHQIYTEELKEMKIRLESVKRLREGKKKVQECISYKEMCALDYKIEHNITLMHKKQAKIERYSREWTVCNEGLRTDLHWSEVLIREENYIHG